MRIVFCAGGRVQPATSMCLQQECSGHSKAASPSPASQTLPSQEPGARVQWPSPLGQWRDQQAVLGVIGNESSQRLQVCRALSHAASPVVTKSCCLNHRSSLGLQHRCSVYVPVRAAEHCNAAWCCAAHEAGISQQKLQSITHSLWQCSDSQHMRKFATRCCQVQCRSAQHMCGAALAVGLLSRNTQVTGGHQQQPGTYKIPPVFLPSVASLTTSDTSLRVSLLPSAPDPVDCICGVLGL